MRMRPSVSSAETICRPRPRVPAPQPQPQQQQQHKPQRSRPRASAAAAEAERDAAEIIKRAERAITSYESSSSKSGYPRRSVALSAEEQLAAEAEERDRRQQEQRQRLEDLVYDFDTSIRKRQHVLSSAEDEAQALQEQSSREAVARVRDRESDESDDEEELKREGVQLIRSAPAVGETLTSQMAEQVGLGAAAARDAGGRDVQGDAPARRARRRGGGQDRRRDDELDRALARAESDLAVALESLRAVEEECARLKARGKKHEVVGKMQNAFGKARGGADVAELRRQLAEARAANAELEEAVVASQDVTEEKHAKLGEALNEAIGAKEAAREKLAAAESELATTAAALSTRDEQLGEARTSLRAAEGKLEAAIEGHIREMVDMKELLKAEEAKHAEARKAADELQRRMGRNEAEMAERREADGAREAETDELRRRVQKAEGALAEEKAKVATLRMRAAAAIEEVKWTREQAAKSKAIRPETIVELEEAYRDQKQRLLTEVAVMATSMGEVEAERDDEYVRVVDLIHDLHEAREMAVEAHRRILRKELKLCEREAPPARRGWAT